MHVENDVQPVAGGPTNGLSDSAEVALVEHAPAGLEQRPVHDQAHAVEANRGHLCEVVLGERDGGLQGGVGLVVVAQLVGVDTAQQHLTVLGVLDASRGATHHVQRRQP